MMQQWLWFGNLVETVCEEDEHGKKEKEENDTKDCYSWRLPVNIMEVNMINVTVEEDSL